MKMKEVPKFYLPSRYFVDVCRVCLSKNNVLIPIKEINLTHNLNVNGSAEIVNLINVFEKFCDVKVNASDNKPQKICEFCINMACKAYNFFKLLLYSNALLDKKLEDEKLSQEKLTQTQNDQSNAGVIAGSFCSPENKPNQDKTAIVNTPDVPENVSDNVEVHTENTESNSHVLAKYTQNEEDIIPKGKKRKLTKERPGQGPPRKRHIRDTHSDILSGIDPCKTDALRVLLKLKNKNLQSELSQSQAPGGSKSAKKPEGQPKLINYREIEYNHDIFKCRLCPKVLNDITKVIKHLKDEHKDARQCVLCPKKMTYQRNIYHVATHSPKALVCRICQLYFENQDDLDSHIENIDHTDIRKCPRCQKSFRRPHQVRDHIDQVHFKKQRHQCDTCGKLFRYFSSIRRHKINTHGKDKRFLCQECGKRFTTLYNLKLHVQNVHKIYQGVFRKPQKSSGTRRPAKSNWFRAKTSECKICHKKFFNRRLLLKHSEIHPEFKDYRCDLCSEVFETNKGYVNHYKTHQKFQCQDPKCGKLFTTKKKAYFHKYSHDKNLSCQFCDRIFRSKALLDLHLNVHTGARPFVCEKCGQGFRQSAHLRVHVIAQHGGKKPWQCRLCDRAFNFSHGLRCHMRTHTGEKPFPCPYCKKMFRDTSGRHKHVKKDHPKKMDDFLIYKEKHQDEEIQKVDRETERREENKNDSNDEKQQNI